jgi:hypothetical protein
LKCRNELKIEFFCIDFTFSDCSTFGMFTLFALFNFAGNIESGEQDYVYLPKY